MGVLVRLSGWEESFAEWITQVHLSPEPFIWGVRDCCLLAADGVKTVTGVDIADEFRSKYSDKASAFAVIGSIAGGSTVADAAAYCANKHKMQEWSVPRCARRGDLVAVKNNDGDVISGIVSLNGRDVICMSESGVLDLPISQVVRAWRVG